MLNMHDVANYVLWVTGDKRAQQPGGFYEKLVEAALGADAQNLAAISLGFPTVATVVHIYKTMDVGHRAIEAIAGLVPLPEGTESDG
jgi:hypothetical protein